MDSSNQTANIVIGHGTVTAVIISFLIFTLIGWARVPPFLAYAFAFMLSFVYLAYSMRSETAALEMNALVPHQGKRCGDRTFRRVA